MEKAILPSPFLLNLNGIYMADKIVIQYALF